ncbi:low affinity iron permease family protein [Pseudomonas sp. HR96]|uniref:low affinity iron permease family protein n=1 Tax=Pseudomonas sp. HR96 TaxID=1027966 RepID=UPI002A74AFC2|nr:low affinity iron permease family protein [Pseudomonas sp. HR96]WPP01791.1 low affinity iron permease family protein [Pseudomonas sp. HR96]
MNFSKFSQSLAVVAGKPGTFMLAAAAIVVWACTGPWFHYNDTWQLIINTSTTIITFLMVFVIQHTQNRDNDVLHIKIDELLRVTREAQNAVMDLDDLDSKQLQVIRKKYKNIGANETVEVSAETTTLQAGPLEEPDLEKEAQALKQTGH